LKNPGIWCAFAVLGILMGKEFLNWVWWYNWEDDEDEPNPAPLLCKTWAVWKLIGRLEFWLWSNVWFRLKRWICRIWDRVFPPEPFKGERADEDGITPTQWLGIDMFGAWEVFSGYYDVEVKQKWDEFLKTQNATEHTGAEEELSAKTVN
jgi:hypothetical protein